MAPKIFTILAFACKLIFAFETYFCRQSRVKVNITHKDPYDPTHTIQYRERKTYFFDAERSNGNKEDDEVNVINIAYIVSTRYTLHFQSN